MKIALLLNLLFFSLIVEAWDEKVYLFGDKPFGDTPTKQYINLHCAQNEFETFIIEFTTLNNQKLMSFDDVSFETTPASPIKLTPYILASHKFKHSSNTNKPAGEVVDIVIPQELVHQKKFKIYPLNVPTKVTALFEVFIPPSTNPGIYQGSLKIKLDKKAYNYPISIVVHPVVLPSRFDLKTTFGFSSWGILKKHYGGWHDGEFELYDKYFEQATNHRIDLHKIYAKFPKPTKVKGKMLDLLAHDENEKYSFLPLWNSLKKGVNSDHAFKWSLTNLPVPDDLLASNNHETQNYFQALQDSVKANDLKNETFVYFADEPKPNHFQILRRNLLRIKIVAPDLNYLMTTHYQKEFDKLINWWVPNYHNWNRPGVPTPKFYEDRKQVNKDEQVWTYVSCNAHGCDGPEHFNEPDFVIDRPSLNLRILPWIAIKEKFSGILYYDTVYGYSVGNESPWTDHFNFTGYGEGNLFYPCNKEFCGLDEHHALASLRLKIFRDGLEDAQILNIAKEKNIDIKPFLDRAIHYGNTSMELSKTKIDLLTAIEKINDKK